MSWMYLFLAGILEACWAVGLKYTDGFTRLVPSLIVISAIAGSMFLLSLALRTLPIGTAYAVWVAIGIVGAAIAQPVLFGEALKPLQIFFLAGLIACVIGLKLSSAQ